MSLVANAAGTSALASSIVSGDHYFSPNPAAPDRRQRIQVRLRGELIEVVTASGTFSPDHLDAGTRILLDTVPEPPVQGTALDLGAGWGPIALSLALASPRLEVWAIDVNERAVELTAVNAAANGLAGVRAVAPEAVPAALRFDVIWSNPPIRIGKPALHELLGTWLPRLAPGGTAWLVVSKNLGADSLLRWIVERFASLEAGRFATSGGFRVLRIHRPAG